MSGWKNLPARRSCKQMSMKCQRTMGLLRGTHIPDGHRHWRFNTEEIDRWRLQQENLIAGKNPANNFRTVMRVLCFADHVA
jgi:hypothetical protein